MKFAPQAIVLFSGFTLQWVIALLLCRTWIGLRFGFLTGENTPAFPAHYPITEWTFALQALIPALLYTLPALLLLRLARPRIWLGLWWWGALVLGGAMIAGSFAEHLGTTWRPHEPFLELYFHPVWLPLLGLVGMILHMHLVDRAVPGHCPQSGTP